MHAVELTELIRSDMGGTAGDQMPGAELQDDGELTAGGLYAALPALPEAGGEAEPSLCRSGDLLFFTVTPPAEPPPPVTGDDAESLADEEPVEPPDLFACSAAFCCCRHLARRFLNHTCNEQRS
jgi:hypothetical protein